MQLWYATGDFYQSRFMSKTLVRYLTQVANTILVFNCEQGLQLKARQLGIIG